MLEKRPHIKTEPVLPPPFPPVGLSVLVDCGGLWRMAYRTQDGKWIASISGEELPGISVWSRHDPGLME